MMLALAVVLLIIGLVFVIAEVFFVSMGMLSLIAGACILGADVLAFQHSPLMGWVFIAAEVVLIPVIVVFAFRLLPRLPFGRRMLLSGPVTEPEGGFPIARSSRRSDRRGRDGPPALGNGALRRRARLGRRRRADDSQGRPCRGDLGVRPRGQGPIRIPRQWRR